MTSRLTALLGSSLLAALGACGGDAPPGALRFGPGEALTQRADNGRTGAYLDETLLQPATVPALRRVRTYTLDAALYAQPLVVDNVDGEALLIVATMANTVSAYHFTAPADSPPRWRVSADLLGTPGDSPRNVGGKNGVLATPVIDKARGLLYVVSRDCDPTAPAATPACVFHLTALRLSDGQKVAQRTITGSVKNAGNTDVVFDPSLHWNRPGLLLVADRLFVAFGSGPPENLHEEDFVYHGWIFGFATADLTASPTVFCTTPDGRGGSVWQGGTGPSADDDHVYFAGANGILNYMTNPPASWPTQPVGAEDSLGKLPLAAATAMDGHYWDARAYHADGNVFQYMESGDNGFGSTAPLLIPGARDLVASGKSGMVYLVDRDTMQERQAPLMPFTNLPLQPGHTMYLHSWWGIPFCTTPAFRRHHDGALGSAYAWAADDYLKSFTYDYAAHTLVINQSASVNAIGSGSSGGALVVVSANGDDDASAIVWAVSRKATGSDEGRVWAFAATTLAELWHDDFAAFQKFTPPLVARGHLFVPVAGAQPQLLDYGLVK